MVRCRAFVWSYIDHLNILAIRIFTFVLPVFIFACDASIVFGQCSERSDAGIVFGTGASDGRADTGI